MDRGKMMNSESDLLLTNSVKIIFLSESGSSVEGDRGQKVKKKRHRNKNRRGSESHAITRPFQQTDRKTSEPPESQPKLEDLENTKTTPCSTEKAKTNGVADPVNKESTATPKVPNPSDGDNVNSSKIPNAQIINGTA